LIIDDFLASGATIAGLARLAEIAGAKLVGIGTLIEKTFEGGRELLTPLNIPIKSLVPIASLDDGQIIFAKE
ncbi:MAG TPA: xanthine phosphoribosyltransferase, partial [Brevefilum fermentans]|nr:xanthine phosphoribosyltransferase [Brevefilum fermentans]